MISFEIHLARSGFSLDVSGELGDGITAVFGPSGAGKSTLLNCLAGSLRPESGRIDVGDRTLYSSREKTWVPPEKRRIGTVYQDGALFPHLDVLANIEFGYRLISAEDRRFDPVELAEFLGLSHLLKRMPEELSGGERQRVAIGRALATSPQLLLLDEPLASLDNARRGSILNYLKRVHAEFGIPMVYVSHSISEVVAIASEALLLLDGQVVGHDRPSALLLKAAVESSSVDRFENILDGVVGESSAHSTRVQVGNAELSTRRLTQNRGERVVVSLGANQIILAANEPGELSARNVLKGKVDEIWTNNGMVFMQVDAGAKFIVELTENALGELGFSVGGNVFLVFKSSSIGVFDA